MEALMETFKDSFAVSRNQIPNVQESSAPEECPGETMDGILSFWTVLPAKECPATAAVERPVEEMDARPVEELGIGPTSAKCTNTDCDFPCTVVALGAIDDDNRHILVGLGTCREC